MAGLPQEGQSFGRYDIVRRIGRGGMGVVYAAVQQGLRREVALKVLSSDLADSDDYRHRFLREAEILARLDSPHIIQVHDAGEQDGWLYIATQLVPDGDLQELLNSGGPLAEPVALDLAGQVADGIATAHSAGIIHRDIKPSNVLLRRRPDDSLQAYVCDLGISRELDAQYTRTQGVIGTFTYMAPERHEGHDATEASDIYALGCLLWAALSGRAPYQGTDSQVLMGHLNGPIPQLDRTDASVSHLNEVLRRSMAKDPAARYPSARAFATACRSIGTTQPADQAPTRVPGPLPTQHLDPGWAPMPPSPSQYASGPQQVNPLQVSQQQYVSGPQQVSQQVSQQQVSQQHFSGPPGPSSFGPGAPQWAPAPARVPTGRRLSTWLVGGLIALLAMGAAVLMVYDQLADDKGGDDKDNQQQASDIPSDASEAQFCSLYAESPERDIDSVRDYSKRMAAMGTPSAMPDAARAGFLFQIDLVNDSADYDEFVDGANNMSDEHSDQVNALDDWATANCP